MSQVGVVRNLTVSPGGLLVVCVESSAGRVREIITAQAHLNWEASGAIRLLSIPDNKRRDITYNTHQIKSQLPHEAEPQHVIVLDKIRFNRSGLRNRYHHLEEVESLKSFNSRVLPAALAVRRLDWLSYAHGLLVNGWRHGDTSIEHVKAWKRQFEKLGHDWVAEGLLKVLDFWSDERVRRALDVTPSRMSAFDCVCVNRHFKAGKSADVIASLVKKQLDSNPNMFTRCGTEVDDFAAAVDSEHLHEILFVEDCMITGNEMVRVLLDLQGKSHSFGSPKTDRLESPESLRRKRIRLRFAVVTNGSVAYIRKFLNDEGLTNIEVDTVGVQEIATLTPEGITDLLNGNLIDDEDCLIDPQRCVIRSAFQSLAIWHDEERRQRAMEFCSSIGIQLYRAYLDARGKPWPPRKISESALGVRGLALALAFTHSVPKETIPLFWASGRVTWGSKSIEWLPLFENAL